MRNAILTVTIPVKNIEPIFELFKKGAITKQEFFQLMMDNMSDVVIMETIKSTVDLNECRASVELTEVKKPELL